MSIFVGYVGAGTACSDGPTPGGLQFLSWFLGAYKAQHATNDGCFNCRPVRGGTALSLHAVGRAVDLGNPAGAAWAGKLADAIRVMSKELGVQCVIYDRRIWSGAHPHEGWRPYSGVDPHTTHLHVELSKAAAKDLTVKRIAAILTPKETGVPIISTPEEGDMDVKDLGVKLTTAGQVRWINANGEDYKLGDVVPYARLALWGGPGAERLFNFLAHQQGQIDKLTEKVDELTRGPAVDVQALAAALAPHIGVVDYPKLAKAVNDDAAKRLAS